MTEGQCFYKKLRCQNNRRTYLPVWRDCTGRSRTAKNFSPFAVIREIISPSLTRVGVAAHLAPVGPSWPVAPCRNEQARTAAPVGSRIERRCRTEKQRKSCTALTKSSEEAALQCPGEKQRGSCTALDEKQRDAVLAKQN